MPRYISAALQWSIRYERTKKYQDVVFDFNAEITITGTNHIPPLK